MSEGNYLHSKYIYNQPYKILHFKFGNFKKGVWIVISYNATFHTWHVVGKLLPPQK